MELKPTDSNQVTTAVARNIDLRIDAAIKVLRRSRSGQPSDAAVHEVRKHLKQVRAMLRLLRKHVGKKAVAKETKAFRDASRPLSTVRDAAVMIETLDGLMLHFKGRIDPVVTAKLRRALLARRRELRQQNFVKDKVVPEVLRSLQTSRRRVKAWGHEPTGWSMLGRSLKRSYRAGRKAIQHAWDDPHDEGFHEGRKRTKDLRYQLEMLVPLWPKAVKALAKQAKDLTDRLGVDHDLAVLRTLVRGELRDTVSDTDGELLLAIITERRLVLQEQALELSQKLFAERPREFIQRLNACWRAVDTKAP